MNATPINLIPDTCLQRIKTNLHGFDEILGGGFVLGQTLLFAGEPGAGKSTLVLQIANAVAKKNKVLYATGEENLGQIKLRANRLNTLNSQILCSENIKLEEVLEMAREYQIEMIIIDSLQMLYSKSLRQPAGSPSQMRYCLSDLIEYTKHENKILIIIGHSTKSGMVAGLLTLQHIVDTVLHLTIEDDGTRKLYSQKNRFGPAQMAWFTQMTSRGIKEIGEKEKSFSRAELKADKIAEILENTGFLNRHVIKSDLSWLFEQVHGKEKAESISGYNITYQLEADED